jgi:hypothetical protein
MSYTYNCTNVKHSCVNTNYNNYAGSSGSMLKKKYANKFNKVSSNKMFSLNGYVNHNYIGNANNIISHDPFSSVIESSCCTNNDLGSTNMKGISVKSAKGYLNSKITSENSAQCYKDVNSVLIAQPLNKHFRSENRTQSSYIDSVKSKCAIDKTAYLNELDQLSQLSSSSSCSNKVNRIVSSNARMQYLINCNNKVKTINLINGFTPAYDIYYNDSTLFNKKNQCANNPKDAKVIAC